MPSVTIRFWLMYFHTYNNPLQSYIADSFHFQASWWFPPTLSQHLHLQALYPPLLQVPILWSSEPLIWFVYFKVWKLKLLNYCLITHHLQQTNTEGQAVDGNQDEELWICVILCLWRTFHPFSDQLSSAIGKLRIVLETCVNVKKRSCVETPEISVTLSCQWLRFANEDCPWTFLDLLPHIQG